MRMLALILSATLASLASAEDEPARSRPELRLFGYGGSLQAAEGGRALKDGGAGVVLGFGLDRSFNRGLVGSLDMTLGAVDYDLPVDLGPFASDEVDLTTLWIGYIVKGVLHAGRAELYAGAGPGLGFSEATVPSTFLLFFSGTAAEENDWGIGLQAVAGLDFPIGKHSRLGFEYRRLEIEADFGELTGGKVDVGGDAFVLAYKRKVGP